MQMKATISPCNVAQVTLLLTW